MGYNGLPSGRSAVRLARTVRVREVGGSNPLAPTIEAIHRIARMAFLLYYDSREWVVAHQFVGDRTQPHPTDH